MSWGYPNFAVTDERVALWYEIMEPIPFALAMNCLKEIMKTPREFAPSVGMIYDACVSKKAHLMEKLETAERLSGLRLLEARNPITPERRAEIERAVRAGEYDDMFKDDPYLGRSNAK